MRGAPAGEVRRPGSNRVAAVLLGSAVAVPLALSLLTDEVFALPKLGVVAASVAVGGWHAVRDGRPPGVVPQVDAALGAFVAAVALSVVASVDPLQSIVGERFQRQGAATLALYAGGFLLARVSLAAGKARALVAPVLAAGGTLVAGYGVLQGVGLDPIWSSVPDGRVTSTIGQPNALAAVLVITLSFSPAAAARAEGAPRLVLLGGAGVQVVALLLTASRGGVLGLLVAAAATAVVLGRRRRDGGARRAAGAGAAAVVIALAVAIPAGVGERLVERVTATWEGDGSVRGHVDLWVVGARVAADHPLLGTGPETFPLVFPEYRDALLPPERAVLYRPYRLESPHNHYLAIAAGSGFAALLAYLAFVGGCIWVATAREPDDLLRAALLAALAGHLVTDLFMTAEVTSTWLFWLVLGVGCSSEGRAGAR